MIEITLRIIVFTFSFLVLFYFFALNTFYLLTNIFAFTSLRRYAGRIKSIEINELLSSAGAPPITLFAPAYNEEATCVDSTRALLTLNYPDYEIMMINDGSKDGTLETMIDAYDMVPTARVPTANIETAGVKQVYRSRKNANLWLIDKENGGKADALNVGLNYCRTPLFCAMDADTLLERDALVRIVRPFLEDASTVAAGGIIRIVNGCTIENGIVTNVRLPKNFLAKFQVMEYLRAFLSGRMGWDAVNAMLIISGAFGMFRRSTVVKAGGYSTSRTAFHTVGEDMELVIRLHRYCRDNDMDYQVRFVPDPVAWTECPESLKILGRQRDRWQRGLYECLMAHRKMLLEPKYGKIGMLAYPYFFFLEMLGPAIELPGYFVLVYVIVTGMISPAFAVTFFMVAVVFGVVLSIAAVGLEELTFRRYPKFSDLLQLFGLAVIENIGYRQMTTYWRIRGFISALRGKTGWGQMERKGFSSTTSANKTDE